MRLHFPFAVASGWKHKTGPAHEMEQFSIYYVVGTCLYVYVEVDHKCVLSCLLPMLIMMLMMMMINIYYYYFYHYGVVDGGGG